MIDLDSCTANLDLSASCVHSVMAFIISITCLIWLTGGFTSPRVVISPNHLCESFLGLNESPFSARRSQGASILQLNSFAFWWPCHLFQIWMLHLAQHQLVSTLHSNLTKEKERDGKIVIPFLLSHGGHRSGRAVTFYKRAQLHPLSPASSRDPEPVWTSHQPKREKQFFFVDLKMMMRILLTMAASSTRGASYPRRTAGSTWASGPSGASSRTATATATADSSASATAQTTGRRSSWAELRWDEDAWCQRKK